LHDVGQLFADGVQVDRVLEPGRERGHGLVSVVPVAVEPPVSRVLSAAARRPRAICRSI